MKNKYKIAKKIYFKCIPFLYNHFSLYELKLCEFYDIDFVHRDYQ